MRSSKEYRRTARETLAGNYGVVIGAYLIYIVIINALSAPLSAVGGMMTGLSRGSVAGAIVSIPVTILLSLVSIVLSTGVNKISFDLIRGEKADISNIFFCITHNPLTVICTYFWILLYLLPGVIVFFVCGGIFIGVSFFSSNNTLIFTSGVLFALSLIFYIVWVVITALRLSMTYFLYYDDPGSRAGDLVKGSAEMMKGNCFSLFKLLFTYLGYYLLGLMSCGLAMLWVSPNISAAMVLFYDDIKNRDLSTPSGTEEMPEAPGHENIYYSQDYWN